MFINQYREFIFFELIERNEKKYGDTNTLLNVNHEQIKIHSY